MKKDNLIFLFLTIFFISFSHLNAYQIISNDWSVKIFYVSSKTLDIYNAPFKDSKKAGSYNYLNKCLVLTGSNMPAQLGWQYVVFPKKGYVEEAFLVENMVPGVEEEKNGWKWDIMFCATEHLFVKQKPDYQSSVTGIINKGEKLLIIKEEKNNNKLWSRILFPYEGYILTEELTPNTGNFVLGLGGSYGFRHIPYEKNLSNYKNPWGGFLEFTKTNWIFNFRFGYKYSEANIAQWILKTQLFYSQIQLKFLRLFENHLESYAFAGGGYWKASLQNMKYSSGSFSSYYPENKDNGLAYVGGGGIAFNSFGFFIDVQYLFFGSEEAIFGKEPSPGEFTNQYKLYPGANQFNVMLGYRFIF